MMTTSRKHQRTERVEFLPAAERAEFVQRNRCITCRSSNLAVVASGSYDDEPLHGFIAADPWGENPLPFLAGKTWTYVQCKHCAQAYHRDILSPTWNARRFEKWMTQDAIRIFEETVTTPGSRIHDAEKRTKHVLQIELLTRGLRGNNAVRVLDFGCGYGDFLAMCAAYGFEAHGIDRSAARRDNARVLVHPELADLAGQPPFHAVTLFEVLEHLDDPRSILEALRPHVMTGGILVLETPDCAGVSGISTRNDYQKINPLDHINGFTSETLQRIASETGFQPIARPVSQVTAEPMRVAKTEVKRVLNRFLSKSTQQYFRKA
jgi:SAM-dependent methyltransferase